MRMVSSVALAAASCLLLAALPARGDDLADAAAKEKARRKAAAPGRVITETDLAKAGGGAPSQPSSEASPVATDSPAKGPETAAPKEGAAKPKTDDEIRAEREKAWRDRLAKVNAKIASLTSEIASVEASVSDLSQNLYSPQRTAQLQHLEDQKKELAAAQQALADLQDEGRRSGLRP